MKGQNIYLYTEPKTGESWPMPQIVGLPFEEYPFSEHGADIVAGIRSHLKKANFWKGAYAVPAGAILPSGTCLSRNTVLLHTEFGEAPASPSDRYRAIGDIGNKVLWTAPEGIELKIKQADVLEFSEINKHFGGPLGGIETFFCGGDSTAWFLQGKASFCYALQKVDNDKTHRVTDSQTLSDPKSPEYRVRSPSHSEHAWLLQHCRRSDSQPFQVLDVYPMAHGVSLTGIGTFGWHSMLTVEIITQK